jgi:hypothetical protein
MHAVSLARVGPEFLVATRHTSIGSKDETGVDGAPIDELSARAAYHVTPELGGEGLEPGPIELFAALNALRKQDDVVALEQDVRPEQRRTDATQVVARGLPLKLQLDEDEFQVRLRSAAPRSGGE